MPHLLQLVHVSIPIESTMDALPILWAHKDEIEGFEVILGNMDDVFVNAVGEENH